MFFFDGILAKAHFLRCIWVLAGSDYGPIADQARRASVSSQRDRRFFFFCDRKNELCAEVSQLAEECHVKFNHPNHIYISTTSTTECACMPSARSYRVPLNKFGVGNQTVGDFKFKFLHAR